MRNVDDARALAHHVLSLTIGADQAQVSVEFGDDAYSRFVSNYVAQNLSSSRGVVSLTYVKDNHIGNASTSDLSDESLRNLPKIAADIASRVPADKEFVSLSKGGTLPALPKSVFASTADAGPDARIDKLMPVFERMRRSSLSSSGFTTTQSAVRAVVNTLGVDASFGETYSGLEIKAIAPNTSGFAEFFSRDYASIDSAERAERAASKATVSSDPQDFPPGTYTVILEPPAFVDCLNNVLGAMNAGAVLEQKSSWMVDRIGQKIFSPNLTIVDDWSHPLLANAPFAGDGTPTQKLRLVDAGVPTDFTTSTYLANKYKVKNTGHDGYPINAVVMPGTKSREELIASVDRGILISRTWYTRTVDSRDYTITGLTRDGVFLAN